MQRQVVDNGAALVLVHSHAAAAVAAEGVAGGITCRDE
jgi:hypothetical protein